MLPNGIIFAATKLERGRIVKGSTPIYEPGDWADVLKQDKRDEIGYRRLAAAIVKSAAVGHDKKFFYSPIFELIMPQYDGPAIWEQLERNYICNQGKWFAKGEDEEAINI